MELGMKLARHNACLHCPYNVYQSPKATGERWSIYCTFNSAMPPVYGGFAVPSAWAQRDPAFMEGPETNCPLGKWAGLAPVDIEAVQARTAAQRVEMEKRKLGPIYAAMLVGLSEDQKVKRLTPLVKAGLLSPEVATQIVKGEIAAEVTA